MTSVLLTYLALSCCASLLIADKLKEVCAMYPLVNRDDEDSAAFQKEEELRDEMRAEEAEYRQQVRDYRDAHVGRY